uniref:Zinc finger, CCHC-type n=1 Tax=Tanacetum cinerariifolium TaxID=118510 RepID=A0A699HWV8_TANCI|nr:hypothetical protein [Tanacetum cinerariifolium]
MIEDFKNEMMQKYEMSDLDNETEGTECTPIVSLLLSGCNSGLNDIHQFDGFSFEHSAELWDSLETKYMVEDASIKKFLMYTTEMNMNEAIQVSCIIDKLPPYWKDFKHTLKHKEELTVVELDSHLRIEESLVLTGNKSNRSGAKGSVDGSSNSVKGQNMFNKSLQVYYVTYVSEAYFVQDDDVAWMMMLCGGLTQKQQFMCVKIDAGSRPMSR